MNGFPWYEVIEGNKLFLQGDFIDECPVIEPVEDIENNEVTVDIIKYDVIIMSQSCGLVQEKLDLVLVCPVWELTEFVDENPSYDSPKMKEFLRRGYSTGYHL